MSCAVSELHNIMHRLGNDTYTLKMTQAKLLKKCDDLTKLVARNGKGNIILLERVGNGVRRELSTGLSIESESIVKTAAKLKKKKQELWTRKYNLSYNR